MSVTVSGSSITFNDGSSFVSHAIGSIGSKVIATCPNIAVQAGSVVAGSELRSIGVATYSPQATTTTSLGLSGSWICDQARNPDSAVRSDTSLNYSPIFFTRLS